MKPEERSVWDEKARLDKERFEVEKALYKGPWKIPVKQKARKDPGGPQAPHELILVLFPQQEVRDQEDSSWN